jgi:hypothetical protein
MSIRTFAQAGYKVQVSDTTGAEAQTSAGPQKILMTVKFKKISNVLTSNRLCWLANIIFTVLSPRFF